ncbi:MAG: serine--tRNA ligase [Candidatus Diapherotrites archaeon]|nr:serine--tRNA ligase [Candidatus Diapherotrites archaeon]
MLDIKLFRETPDIVRKDLKKRGRDPDVVDEVIRLDKEWRTTSQKADKLKHERNNASKAVAEAKKAGKDASKHIKSVQKIGNEIKENDELQKDLLAKRNDLLMRTPNILHESVPAGRSEEDNVPVKHWGKPGKPSFELKPHQDILTALGMASFEDAAEASGTGFYYLMNDAVLLDLALQRFAIDALREKGFTITEVPHMLRKKAVEGSTDLSAFEDVIYKVENEDLYLIATSEHALAAKLMNQVIAEEELPIKYAGISACFRKEIGKHGVDTRGIWRVHQFNKIEQFVFTKPEDSWEAFEEMSSTTEEIFQALEIPYRVVNICTGDIGEVASKKYDIEAWMPRQGKYAEVTSCSNCTDYQARRLNIRVQRKNGERETLHTLNSTALATSRAMVAIIENNQNEDGTVTIPKVLRQYMNGLKSLKEK